MKGVFQERRRKKIKEMVDGQHQRKEEGDMSNKKDLQVVVVG